MGKWNLKFHFRRKYSTSPLYVKFVCMCYNMLTDITKAVER